MMLFTVLLFVQASAQEKDKKEKKIFDHKVNICHATSSTTNPYVAITVAQSSVAELHNHLIHGNGHGLHEGPVFDSEKIYKGNDKWGDIIPPLINENGTTRFPGLNSDAHPEWWARGCQLPDQSPPAMEGGVPGTGMKNEFPMGLSKKNVKIQGKIKKEDGDSFGNKEKEIQTRLDKKFGQGKFKATVEKDGEVTLTVKEGSMILELDIDEAVSILAEFDVDGVEQTWQPISISDADGDSPNTLGASESTASAMCTAMWISALAGATMF